MSTFEFARDLNVREALQIVARSLRYAYELRYRYLVKIAFTVFAILPPLILIWPFKIIIDNVIMGQPLGETGAAYPFFIVPLIDFLKGESPLFVMLTLVGIGFVTIVLVGAFGESGTTASQRDGVDANLAEGTDIATRTENEANRAQSSIGGVVGYLEYLWTLRISHQLNYRLRADVYGRLQGVPMSTLEDRRIGDAVYRAMYDTPAVTELCHLVIVEPIRTITQIAIVLLMLDAAFSAAPELIWIAMSALPVFFVVFLLFSKRLRRQWEKSRDLGSTATATMEESLANILAVQSLGGGQREMDRFAGASNQAFRGYLLGYGLMLMVMLTGIGLFAGVVAYALTIMTDFIIAGVLSAGDLVVVYVLYNRIFGASRRLGGLWLDLQFPIAGMRRVFALMDLDEERAKGDEELAPIAESIEYKGVGFVYPDGTRALEGVSFSASPGQLVALVGPTGAGKTSLVYQLPRFLEATEGSILLDGHDIAHAKVGSLRSQMTFVFQETTLFDGTVEENVRVANPSATDDDIEVACRTAGIHDFIVAQPHGYRTHLGTKGSKLSVGQKQRLAIARGLVRKTPILILDEPTSALDPETEHGLVSALREASADKLVIVIAHRLSTIRNADLILFMESGRILECGTHDQLMSAPDGAYRGFVTLATQAA